MRKQYIYIIQMHTKTIPARLVKLITQYKYSHVGISLDKSCDKIYSFGRKSLNNILDGGFVEEKRHGKFFKKFNKTICRIYELEVDDKQYISVQKQISYLKSNESKYKYDFLGASLRIFNIPVSFSNRYVCSQFVAKVLENAGIYKFRKKVYFIKPKDFEDIKDIKSIYSGEYLKYRCS